MSIKILYIDLRCDPPIFNDLLVSFSKKMSASQAIKDAIGIDKRDEIISDLHRNDPTLTIAWVNTETDEHSDIGGVSALDWEIPDKSILSVKYENEDTSQEYINSAINWMLEKEKF